MPAATCPPFPGSRLLNILGQLFSPVPLCIGSWKSYYWTGPVSRLALFFFNHWNSIWVEMMVIQFASSSSDISSSKGPAGDKWCWKDIMVPVVRQHCSFLLIPQNYLSNGVCHLNTVTMYLNTWSSGGCSVCMYMCAFETGWLGGEGCPSSNKQRNASVLSMWVAQMYMCVHMLCQVFNSGRPTKQ